MYGYGFQNWRLGVTTRPVPPAQIPNPLYVDSAAITSGSGTIDSPLNSLTTALALATGREGQIVCLKSTELNPFRVETVPFESTYDLVIQGWDSEPWYLYGSDVIGGWSSVGSGIWYKSLGFTAVSIATVMTMTETIADREFKLKLIPAINQAEPEQGEIGYSGGVAYIRLPNNEDPNNHIIEIARRNTGMRAWGFAKLIVKDMFARNFLSAAISNGASTQPVGTGNLEVHNSVVEFSGLNGIVAQANNMKTECFNVQAYRCTNDGFNHRRIAGDGLMILNGCKGGYNGDRAGQSSQGASNHSDSTMIINGGEYNYNVSGGMVSIDTSINDLHGDTAYGPILMNGNMRLGNTAGTIASQASCAWMDGATGTVTGPVTVSNGGGVGVRVSTPNAVVGLENINAVGNALPDVIS